MLRPLSFILMTGNQPVPVQCTLPLHMQGALQRFFERDSNFRGELYPKDF